MNGLPGGASSDARLSSVHSIVRARRREPSKRARNRRQLCRVSGVPRAAAASFQGSAVTVVGLTADAMPEAVSRGLAAGFFRYVTKPINVAELTNAIDAALKTSA